MDLTADDKDVWTVIPIPQIDLREESVLVDDISKLSRKTQEREMPAGVRHRAQGVLEISSQSVPEEVQVTRGSCE